MTFVQLADLFLDWCQREKEENTYIWYKYLLSSFCSFHISKVPAGTPIFRNK
jgi:hypothetical protein